MVNGVLEVWRVEAQPEKTNATANDNRMIAKRGVVLLAIDTFQVREDEFRQIVAVTAFEQAEHRHPNTA